MRAFQMTRQADESGVSGTGHVLSGVVFKDGTTVVHWETDNQPSSTAIYPNLKAFKDIHINSHPTNKAKLIWILGFDD